MAASNTFFDFSRFRMDDTDTVDFDGQPYLIFDEPRLFHKFYVPKFILPNSNNEYNNHNESGAYMIIMGLICNFAYLNPNADKGVYLDLLKILNSKTYNSILPTQIHGMADEILYLQNEGGLPLLPNLEKSFLVNPELSETERKKYVGKCTGLVRKRTTIDKLKKTLENWMPNYGKPTNQKIAQISGFSIRTIKDYSPELKEKKKEAIKKCRTPKENKTLNELKILMRSWDLDKGLPTYKDLADASGKSLDTVKSYGKYLQPIKEHLKKKTAAKSKEFEFFAPFDQSGYVVNPESLKAA
ncbi:hypothetical protein [Maribacter sp. 2210JD10-5]|uniref:hypothetical protein n=1 Tax=Maribacter sp. 2210JD10-5 TaxID=3386272 RepID=UPI0039BD4519